MATKKVLICCMGDGHRVPRAIRFSRLLRQAGYEVAIASGAESSDGYFKVIEPPVVRGKIARRIKRYSYFASLVPDKLGIRDSLHVWRYGLSGLGDLLDSQLFDLVLVQDLAMLPVAIRHRNKAKVIFDAREFYPAQNEESSVFNRFERPERVRICAKFLPQSDLIIATSQGHAHAYQEAFGVCPKIILSASRYENIDPRPLSDNAIRLVHHGVTNRNRQLSKLIDLMAMLRDEFTLDFFLVANDSRRIEELKKYASGNPRITFNDPVPFDDITRALSKFDIGISYFEPTTFNLLHTVPNKIFEYVQARLAVCIGPSPSMREVLSPFGCAIDVKQFSLTSVAQALNQLSREEIYSIKQRSDLAARHLNEQNEGDKLLRLVASLLEGANGSRSRKE